MLGTAVAATALPGLVWATDGEKPNIVYVLCDDLGYGDVHCNNENGKIPTPSVDRLAAAGMWFTDAHSGSAVCTPTRYGILTGRYSWRTHLQSGVLGGFSPPLIAKDRLTVAGLLKRQGYATACIGKWHLGMAWPTEVVPNAKGKKAGGGQVDFSKPIKDGPIAHGFDYYFGISASLDMPPYTFIENDHVTVPPTAQAAKEEFGRAGPKAPGFRAADVLPALTAKAVEYVEQHAGAGKPFFLYLPLNAPHTPIAPSTAFAGKSPLGKYGDYVMEVDWALGQVLDALDRKGAADSTLVIFTSDNGCSPAAGVAALESKGHFPSYRFRGYKADIWDGGHRIPFVARWPGKVKAGAVCDDTIGLMDLMATCADLLHVGLPADAGEDSVSVLPDLLGTAKAPVREALVHHSINGSFAIRQGKWKLELCPGSGGWSDPKPGSAAERNLPAVQLYDMSGDVSERRNVYAQEIQTVKDLLALLKRYVADGRSTPGPTGTNDAPIDLWKAKPLSLDDGGKPVTHD
jgi:arylsulfatase A-like enzyme